MRLRTKLLLGYVGFIVALGVLGAWSARTLQQMSAVSGRIIAENYDSVIAAQDMTESLERIDSAALFALAGDGRRATQQAAEHRLRFDAALARAAANITEPGEGDVVNAIRDGRDDYLRRFDEFLQAPGDRVRRYFDELEPRFDNVRADCDRLLRLNQDAMRRKADAASRIARRWFVMTVVLVLILMAGGIGIELSLSNAILGPVRQLTDAATRMAGGDLDAAVPVHSADEIGTLATGFNRMAARIRELRRSDLGQLLVAQQTTEAAIDSLYDPVLATDETGRLTRINPAAERLFGARRDVIGKPIVEVARDPRIAQAVTDVMQSQQAFASESAAAVLPWAVDGARLAFRIRSTPMRDADGRLVGVVTLLEDITHLSEISRLKSEFIAAASHELRTPLTSVQLGLHLLLESGADPLTDRQQEILYVCRDDILRLDRLMRELLDLSRIESGAVAPVRAPVRTAAMLREAVEALRPQLDSAGIRVAVDAAPDLPPVFVDRGQIERVVSNLVTNARRATPEGGSITVSAVAVGNDVAVSVADTGTGIPREYPGEDLRAVRAGAGRPGRRGRARPQHLSANRRSAWRSAERAVRTGQGIAIHFHHTDREEGGAMKILIVDDEAHIRQMMRLTLEASGYEVLEAVNGEQGLIRFGDGSGIDAVVLDQRMPGIDGLQTLREIRARAPGAAVLMVTAFASVELAVEAMKVGAADFLRKPMTPDALRAALGAALAGAHSATGERIVPRPEQKPRIEMVTLNGFRIRRASAARELSNPEHLFHVNRFPDDTGTIVTVVDCAGGRGTHRASDEAHAAARRCVLARAGRASAGCRALERGPRAG